ncbi:MAG: hypothetical protein C4574_06155 [Candidatus Latescibacterota bacterium]|jgi:hypothetical protein|nr:MAG: hypothetical protein C4574_06155 [Candidatus Latescibacterota bacterium]
MRRLLVLLSALLVLTIFTSSAVLAARPSLGYRIQSIVAMFRVNVFPFCGSFFVVYGVDGPAGGGAGYILGGDADDFGNGRTIGDQLIPDPKAPLRSILGGDERRGPTSPELDGHSVSNLE